MQPSTASVLEIMGLDVIEAARSSTTRKDAAFNGIRSGNREN